eukprot:jgi/Phyca11/103632/e_gw1.8.420.1
MHLFPLDFKLPAGNAEQALVYWCCGDRSRNLPPLRQLRPADLSDLNQRKRLCELRFLIRKIELKASENRLSTTNISFSTAADLFQQCKESIELPASTESNRKRRRGQLVWVSVATLLRKKSKTSTHTNEK